MENGPHRLGKDVAAENLEPILRYSPYKTEEGLLEEMKKIPDPTGTRIVIFNLKTEKPLPSGESSQSSNKEEELEFVVDKKNHDILIRPDIIKGKVVQFQRNRGSDGIDVPLDYSLRVLY